jgi:hypothetical protein
MPMDNKNKDIELRSEKVRNIVGKIPPLLLTIGIFVISVIIMLVLALAYFIPYPEYKGITVSLYCDTPVFILKSPNSGLYHTALLNQYMKKGHQTGALVLESDSNVVIPTYADISGYVYYQCDTRTRVKKGDILYTIIPDTISEIYGICSISCDEIGKIQKGQKVSVLLENKLKGFEEITFLVSGQVSKIYPIAGSDSITHENFYSVEISDFPDSLRMCEDKYFLFPNLKFKGKILLSDKPLLKKICGIK